MAGPARIKMGQRQLERGARAELMKCAAAAVCSKQAAAQENSLCGLLVTGLESRLRPGWKKF